MSAKPTNKQAAKLLEEYRAAQAANAAAKTAASKVAQQTKDRAYTNSAAVSIDSAKAAAMRAALTLATAEAALRPALLLDEAQRGDARAKTLVRFRAELEANAREVVRLEDALAAARAKSDAIVEGARAAAESLTETRSNQQLPVCRWPHPYIAVAMNAYLRYGPEGPERTLTWVIGYLALEGATFPPAFMELAASSPAEAVDALLENRHHDVTGATHAEALTKLAEKVAAEGEREFAEFQERDRKIAAELRFPKEPPARAPEPRRPADPSWAARFKGAES